MSSQVLKNPLLWVDCEMTGLDLKKDKIIEIAVLLSSGDLSHVIKGPELIIHQPKDLLDGMDQWCTEHHGESGLTKAVLASTISMAQAEEEVLAFLGSHTTPDQKPVLAGNSVHVDRQFLLQDMPRLVSTLHYRIVDVSTIKELAARWYTRGEVSPPRKQLGHRAMEDILESIKELKYYRETLFRPSGSLRR